MSERWDVLLKKGHGVSPVLPYTYTLLVDWIYSTTTGEEAVGDEEGGEANGPYYKRSQYTGVCRSGSRWLGRISYGGKKYSLGSFETEREAGKSVSLSLF